MKKAIAFLLTLALTSGTITAFASEKTEESNSIVETSVYQSEESPTGYMVAFRYPASEDVERVRLMGEWGFTDLAHASRSTSLNLPATEWQDGYINLYYNGGDIYELELDEESGVWSVDVPLPAGTWSYYFLLNGEGEIRDTEGAVMAYDPGNVPYIYDAENGFEVKEDYTSGIYVPCDSEKQSEDMDEQAPREDGQTGTIEYVTVEDHMSAVYLPYGYDEDREDPYPFLVLIPGGGGTENSWFNKGAAQNILDNMIAEGRTEPLVVLSADINELGTFEMSDYIADYVLPYMEENYNISTDYKDHAYSGLSMGGHTTGMTLANHYDKFGYIGVLSNGASSVRAEGYDFSGIKEYGTTIFLGAGTYDYAYLGKANTIEPRSEAHSGLLDNMGVLQDCLADNEVEFTTLLVPGGHAWRTWQVCLVYMLENILWK
ncbi:MAG: alpha/beta hydrolase-fold protein [Lachnospiraceae bacterium]|nr:alpha/beta hydrolase-fold protein [Robinsoniella sp.]MDY3765692.1 alpha/beta hydrolase-fold protein [Lachnospiraceae bacterium]